MSALGELSSSILLCPKCEVLLKNRTQVVPGEGAEGAGILFIGEAPGYHEDKQGRPFVGPAGTFLNELLALINLKREQVYITNVIKCRPLANRDPLPTEVMNCRPWLDKQIELIHPKMIVTLGRYAMTSFLPGKSIGKIHGTAQKRDGIIYFAMYHPAAALHQQNLRQTMESDMLKIPAILAQAEDINDVKPQPEQLNLFHG